MNIHGAHSYWKQGALGAASMGWAAAWPQHLAYSGRGHIVPPCAQIVRLLDFIDDPDHDVDFLMNFYHCGRGEIL